MIPPPVVAPPRSRPPLRAELGELSHDRTVDRSQRGMGGTMAVTPREEEGGSQWIPEPMQPEEDSPEVSQQRSVDRAVAENPKQALGMLDKHMDLLSKPAVTPEQMEQQKKSRRSMALLMAGLATIAEASRPGATGLGSLARGGMAGLGELERMKTRDTGANAAKEKARGDQIKELRELGKEERDFSLKEAEYERKVRNGTATREDARKRHTDTMKIRQAELALKTKNLGGIKSQGDWLDLAQDFARTDASSYKQGKGGELQMVMDMMGQMKPAIDPEAYERNVKKHGTALNRRHGTNFKYAGPPAAAQNPGAPVPGGNDPMELRSK